MKPQRGRVWIGVAWLLSIVLEEKKAKGPKNEKVEKDQSFTSPNVLRSESTD